jgi:cysteinyl-tRNA synthetase
MSASRSRFAFHRRPQQSAIRNQQSQIPMRIYSTLTRTKEEFQPLDADLVRMYVCGPTVYSHSHIGHAKSYVSFDTIRRHLMFRHGREHMMYVMNITDVGHLAGDADEGEDRVEAQARRENRSPFEIAADYERSFWEDMTRLNVMMPDRMPHATDFIRQQIEMVEQLIAKGLAYEVNGSVYFDVAAYRGRELAPGLVPYGGLTNRQADDQVSGGRIAENPEKRAPQDFAIWKRADPSHFMQWFSPWGWGFPGWHLECSVMSQFYLGATFDIHGGGLDNQFPHHECEIAQSQAANDAPFARYWMHNNLVTTSGKKMGKSLGNARTLKEFFELFDPLAIRYFILQSHYRSPLEFDPEAIAAAATGLTRLRNSLTRLMETAGQLLPGTNGNGHGPSTEAPAFLATFLEAMDDDFNTPLAMGALSEGITEINRILAEGTASPSTIQGYVDAFTLVDSILGLDMLRGGESTSGALTGELVDVLIGLRKEARARKDFATSDAIRDRLKEIGVVLEDTKDGTRWSVVK